MALGVIKVLLSKHSLGLGDEWWTSSRGFPAAGRTVQFSESGPVKTSESGRKNGVKALMGFLAQKWLVTRPENQPRTGPLPTEGGGQRVQQGRATTGLSQVAVAKRPGWSAGVAFKCISGSLLKLRSFV